MNSLKRELTTGFERDFAPVYNEELSIVDAELAARFSAWGNSEEWLTYILAIPEIRNQLLSLKEVDLCVYSDRISFSDPTQENLRSAMGGSAGMIALARNPVKMTEIQVTIHNAMATLLSTIAQTLNA